MVALKFIFVQLSRTRPSSLGKCRMYQRQTVTAKRNASLAQFHLKLCVFFVKWSLKKGKDFVPTV